MLDFVKGAFRGFFVFTLLVCLIGCIIGAAILGGTVWGVGGAILGIIIGGLVGLMIVVTGGGLVATLLNMDENLEIIAENISKVGNTSTGNAYSYGIRVNEKKICPNCKKEVDGDYSGCPHCGTNFSGNNRPISYESIPRVANLSKKKCSKCKKEVNDDISKCPHCGNDTFE